MGFIIEYHDLVRLLKACDNDEDTAKIVADYLDECIDFDDFNLTAYIWNTLLFNVQVFDTKEEALQYIDNELCIDERNCVIWEGNFGTYLEWR